MNEKISARQFMILVCLFSVGTSILITPSGLATEAKQDAWIAVIIGLLIGLILTGLYNKVGSLDNQSTIVELCEKILGKWIGKVVSVSFAIFSLIGSATLLWIMGNFITTVVMPETPIQFTNILFACIVIMGTRLGVETLARAGEIFFPWVIALLLFIFVCIFPQIDLKKIEPVFESGITPLLRASLSFASVASLPLIVLLMIYPASVNNPKQARKGFYWGTLVAGIIMVIVTLLTVLVLGPESTSRNVYPTYLLAKKINIGDFLQRIEVVVAGIWFLTIFFKTTLYYYASVLAVAQVTNLKNYRSLTLPMGMILVSLSLLIYPNTTYAQRWDTVVWIPYSIAYGFLLPVLLLIVGKLRKKSQ